MEDCMSIIEQCRVSEHFMARANYLLKFNNGSINTLLRRVYEYAGAFMEPSDSFNLQYQNLKIVIRDGVLINLFKNGSKG
jgi:hypothetical protein